MEIQRKMSLKPKAEPGVTGRAADTGAFGQGLET